ncbi:hypothetical protein AMATHDRAFT_6643 [Amanita thiersii Skay4041]|uniref:Uncharacterized protein n=1 Tax=Amanita thiersii Skay4041 TaxID=703135 RepID=A0A2A9NA91_9AGAR|nr:hypothetical protein AMATHDRAFT_6643 [Amanita thiersii Skay4041]
MSTVLVADATPGIGQKSSAIKPNKPTSLKQGAGKIPTANTERSGTPNNMGDSSIPVVKEHGGIQKKHKGKKKGTNPRRGKYKTRKGTNRNKGRVRGAPRPFREGDRNREPVQGNRPSGGVDRNPDHDHESTGPSRGDSRNHEQESASKGVNRNHVYAQESFRGGNRDHNDDPGHDQGNPGPSEGADRNYGHDEESTNGPNQPTGHKSYNFNVDLGSLGNLFGIGGNSRPSASRGDASGYNENVDDWDPS